MNNFQSTQSILEFGEQFCVVCPECLRSAIVQNRGTSRIVLTCRFCGHVREDSRRRSSITFAGSVEVSDASSVVRGAPVDWYFHIPLWLQTPCCGEVLWAYNEEHLAFLEAFVGAKQRTSVRDEHGWSNRSLMNRLPLWMKQAKNRNEVLGCIDKLKQKLAHYQCEILHS